MAGANFDGSIHYRCRLEGFEISLLLVLAEFIPEINSTIKQILHVFRFLDFDAERASGISGQSNVLHLVLELLKLSDLPIAIGLDASNDIGCRPNITSLTHIIINQL
jgi:hypothetical protein